MPSARPSTLLHLLSALAAAALACTVGDRPEYTRVEEPAPDVLDRGGAVLVTFWATWCPPCREELPGLLALARNPPEPISVVTFGEDENEARVREHLGGVPPPELGYVHDRDGRAAAAFGVDVLPAAFLAVDGRLVARFSGPRDWGSRAMRRLLARLVDESRRPRRPGATPGIDPRGGGR